MKLDTLHTSRSKTSRTPNFAVQPPQFDPNETIYLREYGRVQLRPICPSDEQLMVDFHRTLSEESVYIRFFEHISLDTRTLHERLAKVCVNTPDFFGIVAELHASTHRPAQIVGVGRLTTTDAPDTASFALLFSDDAENTDLPRKLLDHLIKVTQAYGFKNLSGELLVADHETAKRCRRAGFTLHTVPEDGIVEVNLPL